MSIVGIRKLIVAVAVMAGTVVAGCLDVITGDQFTTLTVIVVGAFMGSNVLDKKNGDK